MKVIFLGTSCMVPTKTRNHSAYFISYKSEGILLDCGEGTQRQIKKANIKPSKITKIFISHWHGDHTLGIPGLLDTLSASEYNKTLEIYGPKGTKTFLKHIEKGFVSSRKIKIRIIEIDDGICFENNDFYIESYKLEHSILCYGFRIVEKNKLKIDLQKITKYGLKEGPELGKLQNKNNIIFNNKKINYKKVTVEVKGKIISYVSDTVLCKNAYKIAKEANILICESTYSNEDIKKAKEFKHLTSVQAAQIAKKSKSEILYLTHFSQRYKDLKLLKKEAQKIFSNTKISEDLMKIKIKNV